jgi:seryl-tRNA synthetase
MSSDPALYESIISVALGAGSGGATAWAVLHTRLSAAEQKLEALDADRKTDANAMNAKHEQNANKIAHLEAGHAATSATMAAMTSSLARVEASLERLTDRMASVPNEVASMLSGSVDSRPRRQ